MITTCTHCWQAWDAPSEEAANEPDRFCPTCWAHRQNAYRAPVLPPDIVRVRKNGETYYILERLLLAALIDRNNQRKGKQ